MLVFYKPQGLFLFGLLGLPLVGPLLWPVKLSGCLLLLGQRVFEGNDASILHKSRSLSKRSWQRCHLRQRVVLQRWQNNFMKMTLHNSGVGWHNSSFPNLTTRASAAFTCCGLTSKPAALWPNLRAAMTPDPNPNPQHKSITHPP